MSITLSSLLQEDARRILGTLEPVEGEEIPGLDVKNKNKRQFVYSVFWCLESLERERQRGEKKETREEKKETHTPVEQVVSL